MKKEISLESIKTIIDESVTADKDFFAGIDFIIGVSRGGLVPAALLAAKIDKPLAAAYINRDDEIFFDRQDWIKGKNVLVVDDIVRSGKTLWLLKNYLEKSGLPDKVSFFALFKVDSLFDKVNDVTVRAREINENVMFPWDN